MTGTSRLQARWLALGVVAGLVSLGLSPYGEVYPAAALSLVLAGLVPAVFEECRPRLDTLLCPMNWAYLYFALQLVVMPTLIAWAGPDRGTLPRLPSDDAINWALLASSLAWIAFAFGARLALRGRPAASDAPPLPSLGARTRRKLLVAFVAIGVVGLFLRFRSIGALLAYYSDPAQLVLERDAPTTLTSAASTFLRPFLIAAPVLGWSGWVVRRGRSAPRVEAALVTGAAALVIILAGGTFNFNRAAFVIPLAALAAAYGRSVRRITWTFAVVAGALIVAASTFIEVYRSSTVLLGEALTDPAAQSALQDKTDPMRQVQVYGGAPQFLGYLLEANNFAERQYWGRTLVASTLFPIPVVGKSFRPSSGVAIYNQLIYGDPNLIDQIIPFQGELYMNFHVVGIAVGFAVIGMIVARLQRRFDRVTDPFEAYATMYVAIWFCFLILGSLAVVSQILVYFCWPVYGYYVLRLMAASSWTARATHVLPEAAG